jgi:acyl-CoA reductase-like NAD-dependent aldehyde dehydrogenase
VAAAAAKAAPEWASMPWEARLAIFQKAGDLLATKYRYVLNAATMLGQSKTAHKAEIDSACELIDFLRFNVYYAGTKVYSCDGRMRVIAALSEPAVVCKVLAHLDLPTTLPQPAPARAPPLCEEDLDQGAFDLDAEFDQRAL